MTARADHPTHDGTLPLATALLKAWPMSKKWLESYVTGKISFRNALPNIRRGIAAALANRDARLSNKLRMDLLTWGNRYGLDTKKIDEPRTRQVLVKITESDFQRLELAATRRKQRPATYAYDVLIRALMADVGEGD